MTKIATAHGEKVVTDVTGTDKIDLDRVTKEFSKPPIKGLAKEWAAALAKESKRLDHETETIGKSGQDADLKTFASNYGPSIRSTFTGAEALEKALKAPKKK